jgi:small subunit ribosomal protein S7
MRGKRAPKRVISPDPMYNSLVIAKFINRVMIGGKKTVAEGVVYGALDHLKALDEVATPMEVFELAMRNVSPRQEVKSRRVGGSSYQVPVEVRGDRKDALAQRWIIQFAKSRPGRSMKERLAAELLDASKNTGGAVKKREDMQKMADANRAFSHFKY